MQNNAERPLLRPNQVADYQSTEVALEKALKNDHIQDKSAVRGQLRRLRHNLETQTPQAPRSDEIDKLNKETDQLLNEILVGMPSQAEMRRCPPGAIGKHQAWEAKNKHKIQRWKNNRLRLFHDSNDVDIANLERFRPTRSSLNFENSLISGSDISLPETVGHCSPYTDEEIKLIKARAPEEVWMKLPALSAEQRSMVRQVYITTWETDELSVPDPDADVPEMVEANGIDDDDEVPGPSPVEDAVNEADTSGTVIARVHTVDENIMDVSTDTTGSLADLWGSDDEPKSPAPKKPPAKRGKRR